MKSLALRAPVTYRIEKSTARRGSASCGRFRVTAATQLRHSPASTFPVRKWSTKAAINSDSEGENSNSRGRLSHYEFVNWFREAWPYIQGHRGSVLVLVFPGEVLADDVKLDAMLQDVSLLHGLGVKIVLVPGTHQQIDSLLTERGIEPKFHGAYRITDSEALAAAMEASGRIRIHLEARLSQGPSIPALRRHGDSRKWKDVGISVASGNFVSAKRRGVVNGVDFGYTGEIKKVDVDRIRDRLDRDCVVLLSNLGFSPTGEVLNCNTYEVATACAIGLQADKLVCMLDGSIRDENSRTLRWMNLSQADILIRKRACNSAIASDYVRAVAGRDFAKSLGLNLEPQKLPPQRSAVNEPNAISDVNGNDGNGNGLRIRNKFGERGFPVGGEERLSKSNGFLSELTAAVYACRAGIRRVHLLDSSIYGSLLLELYTREGVGTMISSDLYEGTRPATVEDAPGIKILLQPLERAGVLAPRDNERLARDLQAGHFSVVEQDGHIIACAALIPYLDDGSAEVAAFAVAPSARGRGRGDSLLGYLENQAMELGIERLFLLTTRTADWFVQRGFVPCDISELPNERAALVDRSRNSKVFMKYVQDMELVHFSTDDECAAS